MCQHGVVQPRRALPLVALLTAARLCALVVEDFLSRNSLTDYSAPMRVVDRVKPLEQLNDEVRTY